MATARRVIATAPRVAEIQSYEIPTLKANEALVRVHYAAFKHGTEQTMFRAGNESESYNDEWKMFLPNVSEGFEPFPLGNMWAGEIIELGSHVLDYKIGGVVCSYGSVQEYQVVNAVDNYRLRKLPNGASWKNALCYDPAQYALGGVRDANVRPGDAVAVFGLGAIGQIAAQICVKLGASFVAVVDPIQHRYEVAMKNGAHAAFDTTTQDVGKLLKEATNKRGVDCVIETSGAPQALQAGLRGLAYGGTVAFLAFGKEIHGGLNFGREAHFNYGKMMFSRAGSEPCPDYPRWNRRRIEETCWEMLMNGYLNCEDIIFPVVPFERSDEAFMKYVDKEPHLGIKLGVEFI